MLRLVHGVRHDARRRALVRGAFLLFVLSVGAATAYAQSTDVVRVEEDWELELASPASQKASPQFETLMSPFGHVVTAYARVTWNYLELPDFSPGGLQLQAWNGENVLFENHLALSPLDAEGETLTWTQVMEAQDGALTFRIANGHSPSQPSFSSANLVIQGAAGLANLNGYNTAVSVAKSGVTFGSNRVAGLRIREVRRYNAEGEVISTDTSSHVVAGE